MKRNKNKTDKNCKIAEKWCCENDFELVSVDSVLEGNRLLIRVRGLEKDSNGIAIQKPIVIGTGTQTIKAKGYAYTVLRNEPDLGTDGLSLYTFTSLKEARNWVNVDIVNTLVRNGSMNTEPNQLKSATSKDFWVYTSLSGMDTEWEIRKLPIQSQASWIDEGYPSKVVLEK